MIGPCNNVQNTEIQDLDLVQPISNYFKCYHMHSRINYFPCLLAYIYFQILSILLCSLNNILRSNISIKEQSRRDGLTSRALNGERY